MADKQQSHPYCAGEDTVPTLPRDDCHHAATDDDAVADLLCSAPMAAPQLQLVSTTPALDRETLVLELDARLNAPAPFVPTREQPCEEMRERGIRIANYFGPCGNPLVLAVGTDRRLKAWLPWTEGRTLSEVVDELTFVLDKVEGRTSPRLTSV
jgi:hypothetical protein